MKTEQPTNNVINILTSLAMGAVATAFIYVLVEPQTRTYEVTFEGTTYDCGTRYHIIEGFLTCGENTFGANIEHLTVKRTDNR